MSCMPPGRYDGVSWLGCHGCGLVEFPWQAGVRLHDIVDVGSRLSGWNAMTPLQSTHTHWQGWPTSLAGRASAERENRSRTWGPVWAFEHDLAPICPRNPVPQTEEPWLCPACRAGLPRSYA